MGFFDKLREGLSKTRLSFSSKKVDENLMEELEEKLVLADCGFETTDKIIESLKSNIKSNKITETEEVKEILRTEMKKTFEDLDTELHLDTKPSVILMVGVNGSGKTTSIGKIAAKLRNQGKKVLIAAGDTFRAGAVEQLEVWAERAKCDFIKGELNQDPASVFFDACEKAKKEDYDILICDTAGRLQNKKSLMDELRKMDKIIDRVLPDCSKETLLTIDGTTGQNAVSQYKSFNEVTNVTGLIVTKLDGTAKGGIVIRLADEFKVPIKFIGVGEAIEDLQQFNSDEFIRAIV